MKQTIALLATGFFLSCQPTFGQPQPASKQPTPGLTQAILNSRPGPELTRFDLNFPGGTPNALVEAIEKASGKPLNAIIPDEHANTLLPALKMNAVTVPQLFAALGEASRKIVTFKNHGVQETSYAFRTQPQPTDDSIWHFYFVQSNSPQESKVCQFFQLAPYLDTYKIEDITTAIETGWKMLGETEPPEIKFHKDTKLLIAVGEPSKLVLIQSVLTQLKQEKSMETKVRETSSAAKSGEKTGKQ